MIGPQVVYNLPGRCEVPVNLPAIHFSDTCRANDYVLGCIVMQIHPLRHFLKDSDLSVVERHRILDLAELMDAQPFDFRPLEGPKSVAVLFDKPSTRTRVSLCAGVSELGGYPMVLDAAATQMSRGETVEDTARVLEGHVAAVFWRTYEQRNLERMAAAVSTIPVINALTDEFHPCQLLADMLTLRRAKGRLRGLKVAYLGDCSSNMAHSYLLTCASEAMHISLAGPAWLAPDPTILEEARRVADASGGTIELAAEAKQAVEDADVVTPEVWASMGNAYPTEDESAELSRFRLDAELLSLAAPDAVVLHCLPAYRGQEISAEVMDDVRCLAWQQAENRRHVQKAVLAFLLDATAGAA